MNLSRIHVILTVTVHALHRDTRFSLGGRGCDWQESVPWSEAVTDEFEVDRLPGVT